MTNQNQANPQRSRHSSEMMSDTAGSIKTPAENKSLTEYPGVFEKVASADVRGSVFLIKDVLDALNEIAPPELAEEWDAVGLQVGDPNAPVKKALISLDASNRSISLAQKLDCQLMLTHHPLIFAPLPALRQDQPIQKNVIRLIQNQIALIAAHTNLDRAQNGVADMLASAIGQSIQVTQHSITAAGPYWRLLKLPKPRGLFEIYQQVHVCLGAAGSRLNSDQDSLIQSVAVWPGSLDEAVLPEFEQMGVQMVICGECKHHLGLMLADSQIIAMDVGHDVSERVVLQPLMSKLKEKLPGLLFAVDDGFDYNKIAY